MQSFELGPSFGQGSDAHLLFNKKGSFFPHSEFCDSIILKINNK